MKSAIFAATLYIVLSSIAPGALDKMTPITPVLLDFMVIVVVKSACLLIQALTVLFKIEYVHLLTWNICICFGVVGFASQSNGASTLIEPTVSRRIIAQSSIYIAVIYTRLQLLKVIALAD